MLYRISFGTLVDGGVDRGWNRWPWERGRSEAGRWRKRSADGRTVRLLTVLTFSAGMTDFDPEKFEDKYVHYFPELQRAYKDAFEVMNEQYDSSLIHGIDQQILNESEPFYEDGEFRIDLPENPNERLTAVVVDDEKLAAVLERYVEELERQLRLTFLGEE
jgi:hypothetical protein